MGLLTASAVMALVVNPHCGAAVAGSEMAVHLQATAMVESGNSHGEADPLVINVNVDRAGRRPGVVLHPVTVEAAIAQARVLLAAGRSFDLGLMQVNNASLAQDGLSIETAFDACRNMAAGAAHFAADVHAVLDAAHRRYNTGSTERGTAYAATVERALVRLQADPGAPAPPVVAAPPPPPPCAPEWDAWALAECSARPARPSVPPPVDGASSTTLTASSKDPARDH